MVFPMHPISESQERRFFFHENKKEITNVKKHDESKDAEQNGEQDTR